jgi:hypothetical protein
MFYVLYIAKKSRTKAAFILGRVPTLSDSPVGYASATHHKYK